MSILSKKDLEVSMTIEQLEAYKMIQKEQIPELNSTGYLLKHKKDRCESGAA